MCHINVFSHSIVRVCTCEVAYRIPLSLSPDSCSHQLVLLSCFQIWWRDVEGLFIFFKELKWFSKCFSLSVHGLRLPFDSSHNTVNAFGHSVIVGSYIQFTADWLSQNKFCLNLGADFPWCMSGLHIAETTRGVYAQDEDFFSPVAYA